MSDVISVNVAASHFLCLADIFVAVLLVLFLPQFFLLMLLLLLSLMFRLLLLFITNPPPRTCIGGSLPSVSLLQQQPQHQHCSPSATIFSKCSIKKLFLCCNDLQWDKHTLDVWDTDYITQSGSGLGQYVHLSHQGKRGLFADKNMEMHKSASIGKWK